jgi:signal transduction histidine kinase
VRPLRTTQITDASLRQLTSSLGVAHSITMPLLRGNEVVGFHIACRSEDEGTFSPLHLRIARGIANLASLALEHARTVSELHEASRIKSEFVATISHELRTPLNVILGYHEMLLDAAAGPLNAAQADLVVRSNRSARQLLELITDTLNLSRLETGRSQIDLRVVRLAELARELESETRGWHEKNTVRAIWDVPDTLPPIYTDPQKLKVVLKNLVSNALKFTDEGEVVVSARQNGEQVEIGVRDTGIGIPEAALDYIFDPFRQADGSSTRRHGGVGLGLYIVRRLLELLDGSVQVESQLGNGSTFRVRLPVARALAA